MKTSARPAPSFKVWLAVALLVVLFFAASYVALDRGLLRDPVAEGNVAGEWKKYRAGRTLVIGVGSSLLNSGLDRPGMEEAQAYQFLAFYRSGATYRGFSWFFQQPWKAEPGLIFIQSDLFLQPEVSGAAFLAAVRSTVGGTVKRALGKAPNALEDDAPCPLSKSEDLERARQYLVMEYRRRPRDETGLLAWIAQRRAKGQAVVLLDIPRSPRTEAQLGDSLVRWRRDLGELGIPMLRYTDPLDESDFCDGSHMSSKGRKVYTRWLRQNIGQLLREPD